MSPDRPAGNLYQCKQGLKRAQKSLEETYKALGARTYRLVKSDSLPAGELQDVIAEIDVISSTIESYEKDIERFRLDKLAGKPSKCPYCSATIPPYTRFCPSCSRESAITPPASLHDMVPCLRCGKEITSDSEFCGFCGQKVAEQVENTSAPADGQVATGFSDTIAMGDNGFGTTAATENNSGCPHCGDLLEPEAAFCVNCGKRIK